MRRVHASAQERFERTLAAFRQLEALRARFLADEIESLAGSNPQFRTILSTASLAQADLGFGGAEQAPATRCATRTCASSRWRPRWRSLPSSDVVLVANADGRAALQQGRARPLRRRPRGASPCCAASPPPAKARRCCAAGERTAVGRAARARAAGSRRCSWCAAGRSCSTASCTASCSSARSSARRCSRTCARSPASSSRCSRTGELVATHPVASERAAALASRLAERPASARRRSASGRSPASASSRAARR